MLKRGFVLLITSTLVYLLLDQYIICPTYRFDEPKPFRGPSFHNPYASYRPQEWTLANLHAHTASWLGVTNGAGGPEDLHAAYDSMGYGIHAVSDYMRINHYGNGSSSWIPAYEHGLNIPKAHQLVVGSRHVTWKDYPFPLTLSNRQDLLNRLTSDTSAAVIINHPAMRIGYNEADLKFLVNYDALEVLNAYEIAFRYWDTALSNGHLVSIVGNDDTHNAGNRKSVGRFATLVHAPSRTLAEVVRSLKEGRTIGVQIPQRADMSFRQKAALLKYASPAILSISVDSGMLRARFSSMVRELALTGQHGVVRLRADSAVSIDYPVRIDDTYLRISYMTSDGIHYYLNPVCRTQCAIGNRKQIQAP